MSYGIRSGLYAFALVCAVGAMLAAPQTALAKADWNPPPSPPRGDTVWPGCLDYKIRHDDYYDIRNRAPFQTQDFYVTGTAYPSTWWRCATPPAWWFSGSSSWEHGVEVNCPVGFGSVTVARFPIVSLKPNEPRRVPLAGHTFTPWADQTFRYSDIKVSVAGCVGTFTIEPYTVMRVIGPGYSHEVVSRNRAYRIYL
jgi:hypothetical protein